MDCNQVEQLLADYLSGEILPDAGEELEAHLASCEACLREVGSLRATLGQLESLPTVSCEQATRSTVCLEVRRRTPTHLRILAATLRYAAVLVLGLFLGRLLFARPTTLDVGVPVAQSPTTEPRGVHPGWVAAAVKARRSHPGGSSLATQLAMLSAAGQRH